jgi:hypothetical protein
MMNVTWIVLMWVTCSLLMGPLIGLMLREPHGPVEGFDS